MSMSIRLYLFCPMRWNIFTEWDTASKVCLSKYCCPGETHCTRSPATSGHSTSPAFVIDLQE